jgi:hypothetical protein
MRRSNTERSYEDDYRPAVDFARKHGLEHEHGRRSLIHQWDFYPFGVGTWRRARNVVHGAFQGRSVTAFEYHYFLLSDTVEENGYQRDSLHRFLVCVIDLDHAVPFLAAVRTDWFEWHDRELAGLVIDVDHEQWNKKFVLVGDDVDYACAVLSDGNAARCSEIDMRVEWRFEGDEMLLWVLGGRVDKALSGVLEIARPMIKAAEQYMSSGGPGQDVR